MSEKQKRVIITRLRLNGIALYKAEQIADELELLLKRSDAIAKRLEQIMSNLKNKQV